MQTRARRVTLAGGSGRSVLAAASDALFPFFDTREAAQALRGVCREFAGAVARHAWRDLDTVIARLSETGPMDQLHLQRLKKRKLLLKDEIAWLESRLIPDNIA